MKEITTEGLKKLIDEKEKFILLDCRLLEKYQDEHIPGSLNLHWKNVLTGASEILPDKNMMIVTYCSGFTCDASVKCYQSLKDLGYTNLIEYSGGIEDWKAHGFTTEKSELT